MMMHKQENQNHVVYYTILFYFIPFPPNLF